MKRSTNTLKIIFYVIYTIVISLKSKSFLIFRKHTHFILVQRSQEQRYIKLIPLFPIKKS